MFQRDNNNLNLSLYSQREQTPVLSFLDSATKSALSIYNLISNMSESQIKTLLKERGISESSGDPLWSCLMPPIQRSRESDGETTTFANRCIQVLSLRFEKEKESLPNTSLTYRSQALSILSELGIDEHFSRNNPKAMVTLVFNSIVKNCSTLTTTLYDRQDYYYTKNKGNDFKAQKEIIDTIIWMADIFSCVMEEMNEEGKVRFIKRKGEGQHPLDPHFVPQITLSVEGAELIADYYATKHNLANSPGNTPLAVEEFTKLLDKLGVSVYHTHYHSKTRPNCSLVQNGELTDYFGKPLRHHIINETSIFIDDAHSLETIRWDNKKYLTELSEQKNIDLRTRLVNSHGYLFDENIKGHNLDRGISQKELDWHYSVYRESKGTQISPVGLTPSPSFYPDFNTLLDSLKKQLDRHPSEASNTLMVGLDYCGGQNRFPDLGNYRQNKENMLDFMLMAGVPVSVAIMWISTNWTTYYYLPPQNAKV
jgi:hypothetical protein